MMRMHGQPMKLYILFEKIVIRFLRFVVEKSRLRHYRNPKQIGLFSFDLLEFAYCGER